MGNENVQSQSILSRLGVTSASIHPSTNASSKGVVRAAAAMAIVMGLHAGPSSAADLTTAITKALGAKDDSRLENTAGVAVTALSFGLMPAKTITEVSGAVAAETLAKPLVVKEKTASYAAGAVATAVGVATVAPPLAGLLLVAQASKTYRFVKDKQAEHLWQTIDSVEQRVATVQAEVKMRLRMEHRVNRSEQSDDVFARDQKQTLERALAESAAGDLSSTIEARISVEVQAAKEGRTIEPWYREFQRVQLAVSPRAKMNAALAGMSAARSEASSNVRPGPTLR